MKLLKFTETDTGERAIRMNCHGSQLFGILHGSDITHNIGVVMVVGGRQYRVGAHRQFVQLARHLAGEGLPVLRFDTRGMGDSEGQPQYFLDIDDDIEVAIETLKTQNKYINQVVLWGLCDGASAAISVASTNRNVHSVVMVNPWITTNSGQARTELRHYYLTQLRKKHFWRKLAKGKLNLVGSLKSFFGSLSGSIGVILDKDHASQNSLPNTVFNAINKCNCPINLIFSSHDMTAREFEDELIPRMEDGRLSNKSNITVTHIEADHTFSDSYAQKTISEKTLECIRQ